MWKKELVSDKGTLWKEDTDKKKDFEEDRCLERKSFGEERLGGGAEIEMGDEFEKERVWEGRQDLESKSLRKVRRLGEKEYCKNIGDTERKGYSERKSLRKEKI